MNNLDFSNLNNDLDKRGYTFLPDIRNEIDTDEFANLISAEMKESSFIENAKNHKKLLQNISYYDDLKNYLYSKAKKEFNYRSSDNEYLVSRKVEAGDMKEMYRAHFDSHLFTLVIPIKIPFSKVSAGELIYFPNLRTNPSSELSNLITKTYFKKYASKKGVESLSKKSEMKINNFFDYKPILFRGNTFLHTNKGVAKDATSYRLTCLSHFFDPYENFGVGKLLRILRRR